MRRMSCGANYLCLMISLCCSAQQMNPDRPGYKQLRYEEDWSGLRRPSGLEGSDLLDGLKYVPLRQRADWYLTLGGEMRQRFEFVRNGEWGREPETDHYLLQRYMLHADFHVGPRFRFFGQLKSGIEVKRKQGPRPADADRLDVHQAFFDLSLWQSGKDSIAVRAGRQEISFGSSRLISFREGPNVRQGFDGARVMVAAAGWKTDLIAMKPSETGRGVFDNSPDHTRSLWGVYATRPWRAMPKGHLDLYYLGLDRKRARFDVGAGREQRHSLGTRLWGKTESWDYNYEFVLQWGRFGGGDIRAWTIGTDTGYRIESVWGRPRFGLRGNVTSGDRNPSDRRLGTFNALFPKGAYFSEADLLGPYNLMDLHPMIEIEVARSVTVTPDAAFFWRQSTKDGIYGVAGNLIQSGRGVAPRSIGAHTSLHVDWRINRHASLTTLLLHFVPGEFLKQAPPNRKVTFVGAWITYKF